MRNLYQPYIRKSNGREKSDSFVIATRLAFYSMIGRPYYVMVQRGFPNNVIGVGKSKREIQQSILTVRLKRKSFRKWAKSIQRMASKKE